MPASPLSLGFGVRGQDLSSRGNLSTHCRPTALLLVHEFGVVCQDEGQVGLSGFLHALNMAQNGTDCKGVCATLPTVTRSRPEYKELRGEFELLSEEPKYNQTPDDNSAHQ